MPPPTRPEARFQRSGSCGVPERILPLNAKFSSTNALVRKGAEAATVRKVR
jgi:hypothetical protein